MPEQSIPGAPPAIAAAVERLTANLKQAAGSNLAAVILYGGLARGRYRPGKSDINLLVMLHNASASELAAVAPALQTAWREAAVEPMILTPAELPRAAHDFPTKFLDIKRHHMMLAGNDPFVDIEVPRDLIRFRTEQELRNLLLRMRHHFVSVLDDRAALTQVLARTARPFALVLAALLEVAGKKAPEEDHTADIFNAAASAFELPAVPLAQWAALRQSTRYAGDVAALFRDVLEAMSKAASVIERFKGESP